MKIKYFQKLSDNMAASVDQFIAQNFYAEGERTPKLHLGPGNW